MPATPPPLWDGYENADEDKLRALLDRKVDAAVDPDESDGRRGGRARLRPSDRKPRVAEAKLGAERLPRGLHAEADRIRKADIGSWRPK